ncbi:uncharacterized protein K441DRAFT_662698 [Cenococcum geophilum 1.58]|uniref:uncharacterized protein n=1 Tax=Cenococcum geophilum 1.58 TaxID=794803 RepID=UPI00358DF762|nr:hypothetical protein K441DRAFT_662698 [Cenococcum geophilum 1.58]
MYRLPKCVQRDDELQVFVQDKVVGAVEGMSVFRVHVITASSRLSQVSSRPSRFLTGEPRPKVQLALEDLSKGSKALNEIKNMIEQK